MSEARAAQEGIWRKALEEEKARLAKDMAKLEKEKAQETEAERVEKLRQSKHEELLAVRKAVR